MSGSSDLRAGFGLDRDEAEHVCRWILQGSTRHRLPADRVPSGLHEECSFRVGVRSYRGAVGPAQVRAGYRSAFCRDEDPREPEENVHSGVQVLAHPAVRCGEVARGLRQCDVGPANGRDPWCHDVGQRHLARVEDGRGRLPVAL